jgi:histone acetyltransferase (RNA polymerase elongator complex component)
VTGHQKPATRAADTRLRDRTRCSAVNAGQLKPDVPSRKPALSIQLKESGIRPFIIPVFLPHAGCPHQCVFCNQVSITGALPKTINADHIRSQIHQFLRYKTERRKPVEISFFGGNFLGLKTDEIQLLLNLATEFIEQGVVDGIRFSTRPDTITPEGLNFIADYPVQTVELGVQSMEDHILAQTRRGHSAADSIQAVRQLKAHDIKIGLQMMVGLPGDTAERSMVTAEKITALRPNFVRIYPTLVVKDSQLARWYQEGTFVPLSLAEAVERVKHLYRYFNQHNINVIRMGLQTSEDLDDGETVLAGPYHPAFGHLVYSEIFYDAAAEAIECTGSLSDAITIYVHPRSISKMRGLNNTNIAKLKNNFHFKRIEVVPASYPAPGQVMIGEGKIEIRVKSIGRDAFKSTTKMP